MAVTRYGGSAERGPFTEIERLQDEINKLFDFDHDVFSSSLFDRSMSPAIDVEERTDDFVVTCELPGVERENIDVSLSGNNLTIKGRKSSYFDEDNVRLYRSDIWSGDSQRTLSLPTTADPDKISADLKDGILTVVVPKREEVKPKQISVNVK